MTNTKNSFTRFAAAAKDCFYVNSFRADLVQCDRALKMDGEMRGMLDEHFGCPGR